mgnify:CR=1 FL=1
MIAVIGAGVSGLATALALATRGRQVVVLERHPRPGLDTSTHNSGVIHAGLYYPPGSLKARLCLEGRERLFVFAEARQVPVVRCGKLIVATTSDEIADLDRVTASAAATGARVESCDAAFIAAREPRVRAVAALWSPDTGWIDADAYVRALAHACRAADVALLVGTAPVACEPIRDGLRLVTPRETIDVEAVVNAAGLFADDISALCGGEAFTIYPCRGEYAELAPSARGLVNGLVYPVPHASGHGLGVHLTRTLSGAVWIGPSIDYRERKDDYEGGRMPLEAFLEPTQRLLPDVQLSDLRLGGSGLRAKLHPPTQRFSDFMIRRDARNPRLWHAAGIESPGLTASLAIGEYLAALIDAD